jgi:hypothetical protein
MIDNLGCSLGQSLMHILSCVIQHYPIILEKKIHNSPENTEVEESNMEKLEK